MYQIEGLSRRVAAERSQQLLALPSGLTGDDWTADHFESNRNGKWSLSLIAFDDERRVVGYAIASQPDPLRAHLHRIVVSEALRGKGLGGELVAALKTRALAAGLRQLSLKVAADNDAATRFYANHEFVELSNAPGAYRWMSAPLTPQTVVACHQPNFLPWAGFWSKLVHCDCFVILDDVQMPTGRSYVSRTRIADGVDSRWLTVPVTRASDARILDVRLAEDKKWRGKHLGSLRQMLAKAPYRDDVLSLIEGPYGAPHERLAELNLDLMQRVATYLGLRRRIVRSSEFDVESASDQRLLDLVLQVDGNVYLSGKGGQNYQSEQTFTDAGVELNVREYAPIEYARGPHEFVAGLSMIDLIAWCGPEAIAHLRYPPATD
ncbi:MAG: WbqC family protein [Gammaproteobacteria bacterium]